MENIPVSFTEHEFLNNKEVFLTQLVQSLADYSIFTTDTKGFITSWTKGAENVFGYNQAEILGKDGRILYTAEDVAALVPEFEMNQALTEGRGINERYHVRKDGTVFWGSGLVFPLLDAFDKLRGFTKIMRNLTWIKETEEEAAQVKTLFKIAMDASPTPLYVCTGDDMIISAANPATLKAWGKDSSIIGKKFSDALPEFASQPFLAIKRKVFESGVPYHSEGERVDLLVDVNKQTFYFKLTYQPLEDKDGKIYGLL